MLELHFEHEEDENGVVNGISLAGEMLQHVAFLLGPYVRNCPGCVDTLFSALANRALADFHAQVACGDLEPTFLAAVRESENPDPLAPSRVHFEAFRPLIASMLKDSGHSEAH